MDEQHDLEILGEIFKDEQDIVVHISIRDLWMIDSAMAVTVRHPDISLMQKNWITHIHDQVTIPIIERHPEAKALIDKGWNEAFDVLPDPVQRASIDNQFRAMSKKYLRKTGRT